MTAVTAEVLAPSQTPRGLTVPLAAAWALGAVPVAYLALSGGGYDVTVRSPVMLLTWWLVLLLTLGSSAAVRRINVAGWIALALLAGFVAWTAIAASWSLDPELSVGSLGLVAGYLGVFLLALLVVGPATVQALIGGLAASFALVALLAVLSRLIPGAFPLDHVVQFFPGGRDRLDYPLNYADGTGEFLAMGLAPLLFVATGARQAPLRAFATAALALAVLAIFMTASRGALITASVAVLSFLLLVPDRLNRLIALAPAAAASAALVLGLLQRPALREGIQRGQAPGQRHALLVIVVLVGFAVMLGSLALAWAGRRVDWRPRIPGSGVPLALGVALLIGLVCVLLLAAGAPAHLSSEWNRFTQVGASASARADVYSRLTTVGGSHRYQYWSAAVAAFRSQPLRGIGPGTFQYWWAAHGTVREYVLNAHSLYLETLAETGVIGLGLLAGGLASVLIGGILAVRRAPLALRPAVAAALAGYLAFLVTAGFDWVWQIAVIPVVALMLGAVLVAVRGDRRSDPTAATTARQRNLPRALVVCLTLAAVVAIVVPYSETLALRRSQDDVGAHDYRSALAAAATAQSIEPYAAGPRLQGALILEAEDDLPAADANLGGAIRRSPANWQLWLIQARLDVEMGHTASALTAYRHAAGLDPLFIKAPR